MIKPLSGACYFIIIKFGPDPDILAQNENYIFMLKSQRQHPEAFYDQVHYCWDNAEMLIESNFFNYRQGMGC
jgi:hypothetical protein